MKNLIKGEKPEFGNLIHIAFCRKIERIFKGEESIHEIDWQPCHYWGKHTDTGKPKFRYVDFKNADALVDFIPCPKCQKRHCLLLTFDPLGNWYDELIAIDRSSENFECWNCKLEFETIDRNVFVKT
jgi:hypothetical protein